MKKILKKEFWSHNPFLRKQMRGAKKEMKKEPIKVPFLKNPLKGHFSRFLF